MNITKKYSKCLENYENEETDGFTMAKNCLVNCNSNNDCETQCELGYPGFKSFAACLKSFKL